MPPKVTKSVVLTPISMLAIKRVTANAASSLATRPATISFKPCPFPFPFRLQL